MENVGIVRACEAVGGAARLAQSLGVVPSAITQWRQGGRPVPVLRCMQIERVTAGAVTRRDLRPDDWQRIWPELATPTDEAA